VETMGSSVFSGCENATIYCKLKQFPSSGWNHYWNDNGAKVVWGYKG
jgi:hypothetical protein